MVLYGTLLNEDRFICQTLFQNPEISFGIGLCFILRHFKNILKHPKLYRYCSLWLLSLMETHWDFDFSSVSVKKTCWKCWHLSWPTCFLHFEICNLRNTTEWNCISWGFIMVLRHHKFSPYAKEQQEKSLHPKIVTFCRAEAVTPHLTSSSSRITWDWPWN